MSKNSNQQDEPIPIVVKELVLNALERREERVLSSLAAERDTSDTKRMKHADVWMVK